jgi:hypothetical protein
MLKLSPSILSADFANLGNHVREVEAAGADRLRKNILTISVKPALIWSSSIPKLLHTSIGPSSKFGVMANQPV